MNTIEEVIQKLRIIVSQSESQNAAHGYFAALYLQMTIQVADGIKNGDFEDGDRMEKLDVLFANRYFEALENYKNNQKCSKCWEIAFNETKVDSVSVLQHLLCGINAHINLDLGIAAFETVAADKILELKTDFYRINGIISGLLEEVQTKLNTISWPMKFLDKVAGNADTAVANFSISIARDAAWKVSVDLANGTSRDNYVANLDSNIATLGSKIVRPGFVANFILKPVKWFEQGTIADKIKLLLS